MLLEDIKNPHLHYNHKFCPNDRSFGYDLKPKQKVFCDLYLKTGNLTKSAKESGYTSKNSKRLLGIRAVQEYLKTKSKSVKVSKNWYISKLSTVIEGGIPEQPIPEQEKIYSARDALMAGDQLCKLSGFYEPEKRLNINTNLDDMKELMNKIKEKERGF